MARAALVACGLLSTANAEPLPSLDEMLGLADPEQRESGEASSDAQRDRDLERELTAQQAAEAMQEALRLMDDVASEISARGTGLTTERLQEDVLRKLDQVIESAQQNQGQSGGSSGSSSQSQQPSSPGQQRSGGQSSGPSSESSEASLPPSGTDASLRPQTLPDAASWGALPDRLRGALEQGVGETFSSAYRRLTEAYYRKLAEQAKEER